MAKTVLTAVAWPYANGPRHIGHVAGFGVPSDVFARYHRMVGSDVLMVSGTDEHGTPLLDQAEKEGVSVQELADQGATCHARRGAELVRELLPRLGLADPKIVEHIAACVLTHRFRARNGDRPETVEARIVFDADKLDSIGAIGIGRSFHFAGRIGARVHNAADEAQGADSYSRQDSAYREYLVKLRHVRQRLLTDAGRWLAEGRHRFMVEFFEQIDREVRGEDLLAPR